MNGNNKKITFFLVLLLMGIWGSIAYQLFGGSSAAETNSESSVDGMTPKTTPTNYEYVANVRDPFSPFVPIKKKEVLKKASAPPAVPIWTPPPFRLTGIVVDERKRTAMLEGTDGVVYFLKEGDSLRSLKIRHIDQTSVTYLYLSEKGSWTLER